MSDAQLVEVYRARDNLHARMLNAALDDAGIRAHISGELLQGALGEVPLGWPTAPRILVSETDAERAREILQALEESKRPE